MKLSFHGAARTVTGSCHLLEMGRRRILIDCGMVQGSRDVARDNAMPFGFDPASIDTVLLTHAHLDHCGRLPLLVNRGFGDRSFAPPRRAISPAWCCWIRRICRRRKRDDGPATPGATGITRRMRRSTRSWTRWTRWIVSHLGWDMAKRYRWATA